MQDGSSRLEHCRTDLLETKASSQGQGQASSRPRPTKFVLEVSSISRSVLKNNIAGTSTTSLLFWNQSTLAQGTERMPLGTITTDILMWQKLFLSTKPTA